MRIPLCTSLLFLAACTSGPYAVVDPYDRGEDTRPTAPDDASGWGDATPTTEGTVYGWDGAPVGSGPLPGQRPGTVRVTESDVGHALEGPDPSGGSRMVLLEQYNRTVEERENLEVEVEALNAMLARTEQRNQDLQRRLEELEASYESLAAEKTAVEEELRRLAARLTTAQIRRLEAEKAWLETAIERRERSARAAAGRARLAEEAAEGGR